MLATGSSDSSHRSNDTARGSDPWSSPTSSRSAEPSADSRTAASTARSSGASPGWPSARRPRGSARASGWSSSRIQPRREVARICGEAEYEADFGPWISECAAQFIPCVSEAIYHRRYQEADKVQEDGSEIDWPVPFWWVDVGATMQNIMLAAVNEGLGCGFVGPEIEPLRTYLGIPDEFTPIGVMPVGRALPDVRSPSLRRGWVPFEDFARWERWG